MKVHMLPAARSGCFFYRQGEPGRIAVKEGYAVSFDGEFAMAERRAGRLVPAGEETLIRWAAGEVPKGIVLGTSESPADFTAYGEGDVVVFQRQAKRRTVATMRTLRAQGATVVYDVDDDFSCLDPRHPAFAQYNPATGDEISYRNIQKAAATADLVTVTTPALAERYGAHGRVVILPNCVPEVLLGKPSLADGRTLGWTGAPHIHPGDLEAARGGVATALEGSDWHFLMLGPEEHAGKALGCSVEATGWLTIDEYHQRLGQLDVGIVPLAQTKFNEAKSFLKGIEYAARGIPFVASQLPEYVVLANEGIGLVAPERGRSWASLLRQLISSAQMRNECRERGRALVAEKHTYETQGWRWLEAWQQAMSNRRLRPAA